MTAPATEPLGDRWHTRTGGAKGQVAHRDRWHKKSWWGKGLLAQSDTSFPPTNIPDLLLQWATPGSARV